MIKKEITRDAFIARINYLTRDDKRQDIDKHYILKGGRGFVNISQKMWSEELNSTLNQLGLVLNTKDLGVVKDEPISLKMGYQVQKLFISGIGGLEIQYDKKFDEGVSRELDQNIIRGLPECSYEGELFNEEKSLGFVTSLMLAPYQNITELVDNIKITISRHKTDIDELLKELNNIELN